MWVCVCACACASVSVSVSVPLERDLIKHLHPGGAHEEPCGEGVRCEERLIKR